MKLFKLILLSLSLLTAGTTQAQVSSFYGKKFYLEFNAFATNPFFAKRLQYDSYYWRSSPTSKSLVSHNDRINYGYTGSIVFLTKGQVSVGVAASLFYSNAPGLSSVQTPSAGGYENYIGVQGEALDLRTFFFMPILNISSDKIIKPAGLNHEVGIGMCNTRIQDRDYLLSATRDDYYDANDNFHNSGADHYIDSLNSAGYQFLNTHKTYKRVCLMYGIKMRTPISKNIMINYGFRYTLNLGQKGLNNNSQARVEEGIGKTIGFSFISFGAGITLML